MKTAETSTDRHDRGSYYTPPELVARVVPLALQAIADAIPANASWRDLRQAFRIRVIDPACGDGNFLLGAAENLARQWAARFGLPEERLRRAILRRCVYGIDLDPVAVASALTQLTRIAGGHRSLTRHVVCADSLLTDFTRLWPRRDGHEGFDAVIGNPPFVDAETMTRIAPKLRRTYRDRWSTARGNWDLCVPFVELSLRLLCPGASFALVLPNKLLSARYADRLRVLLRSHHVREVVDLSRESGHWNAGVYPIVLHVERAAQPEHIPATKTLFQIACADERRLPLGELATIHGAATVAEAYEMVDAMEDCPAEGEHPGNGVRVVNTGTIRRYTHAWGHKPMRYLGRSILRPFMRAPALRARWPRRAEQAAAPKLIVAGLAKELRACFDPRGELLAAKSTVVITSDQIDLRLLEALLNSRRLSDYYRAQFGGLALQGGYLQFTTSHLKWLPVPTPERIEERSELVAEVVALVDRINLTSDAVEFQRLDDAIESQLEELLDDTK